MDHVVNAVEQWLARQLGTRRPPKTCAFCGERTAELAAMLGRAGDRDAQQRWVCRRCHGVETRELGKAAAAAAELKPSPVPRL